MNPGRDPDVRWRDLAAAYAVSVLVTIGVGGTLFLAVEATVWWIAAAGVLGLLAGGAIVGARHGRPDALGATLLAIAFYGTTAFVIVGGALADLLPEPLPGLPVGDSTFFFVWPLTQLAAAVIGATAGGRSRGWASAVRAWRPRRRAPTSR